MMVLQTCIAHNHGKTTLDIRVKGQAQIWTVRRFFTITLLPFNINMIKWWYFTLVLLMIWREPLLNFKSKGQRSRSNLYFEFCMVLLNKYITFCDIHNIAMMVHLCCLWHEGNPIGFVIWTLLIALPTKNIKVINSFYKGMHDMQRCLRL